MGGAAGSSSGGATGGAAGSGGAIGAGGTTSSGGETGPGGTTRTGGAQGSGGVSSSSAGTGSGGRTGRGGATGSGGATATGGGTGGTSGAGGQGDAAPPRDVTPGDAGQDAAKDLAADAPAPPTDAADARPAQCPSTSTLKAGDNKATLQFGGRSRSYVVYVPSSVKAGTAVPLIFDFHGHGGSSSQEESASGWKKKADQVGFVMVYPDGVDSSWNVGNCCGLAMSENVDDVGFTRAMITAVSQAACIDAKRIYATGMSNGAGFVHRLGCEAADVIAAIAAASADLVTDPCTPVRPIAELSVRGLSDTTVAYAGGNTGSTGWYDPGAKKSLDLWKTIDQCTGSETTTHQYCESYTSCAAGVEVTLCSLPSTGHDTYNNAVGMSVPDVAWEMFQRQPMP
jgi:polyhydroxybutyrate depolymerase